MKLLIPIDFTLITENALKLDPDYEAALMNKVAILLMQKKNSEAIFILKRVLKINPTNEKANFALTQLDNS